MLAAKFYCDETLYSHLAFDFGIDKTTGKSRQKHYIRTSHIKAKEGFILLYTVYTVRYTLYSILYSIQYTMGSADFYKMAMKLNRVADMQL